MSQGSEEGKCSYLGRSWIRFGFLKAKKSADAILATGNEPPNNKRWMDSQGSEGPNVSSFLNSIRKLNLCVF